MLSEIRHLSASATLALWHMTETSGELFGQLAHPEFYTEAFAALGSEKRRREWLASKLLVQQLCGADKKVVYSADGKPSLEDRSFFISISHSENYAVLIISKTRRVAVDIERISPKILPLKERFMTPAELASLDSRRPLTDVLLHWCAKEAAYKLSDGSNGAYLTYAVTKNADAHTLSVRISGGAPMRMAYEISADYVLVWAEEENL